MLNRDYFVDAARKYKGVRWKHQGRSFEGIDCVGLVVCTLKDCGLIYPDETGYSRRPDGFNFVTHFKERGGIFISKKEMKTGDIIIFSEQTYPCHVGIFINDMEGEKFIHAHIIKRRVAEEFYSDDWKQKTVAIVTVKEFE